ncbi:uncharacterized protein [Amphiura filiformis]|uniref:uncharacterized protein isoform X1 n=1 Tax=Amphiura filiformis TaxID=82378 RepID=UPI003B20E9D7
MADATEQMSYSMESMDTSQMSSFQTGFGMTGQGSNSQKYTVPISPKPYQCAMCHKAFRSVQVLQKHTQTFHMRPGHGGSTRGRGRGRGLNQFAKTLAYRQQAQQALISRQAELQSQSFTCVICNQTFDRPELLSEHITNSHSGENSLAATLPGLPTQFDVDQPASMSDIDISHSQVLPFPHSAPSGLDLTSGSLTQQPHQPYILQSPFKYQHGPDTSSSNRPEYINGSSGSPGSQSKRKWSFQRKEVTIRTIMSAILLSAGPISTHYAVRRYGPKYLRTPSIPKEQYVLAATALQEAKLGMLITVKNATGLSDTFIKRAPSEIEEELRQNSDLATIEEYTFRFHAPPPACITPTMQASIIQHGLLPPGSFSEKKFRQQPSLSLNPSQVHDLRLLQIPTSLVQTVSTQSAKMKKETLEMLGQQQRGFVPPIHTSGGQTVMTSSHEPLPIMIPNPAFKLSGEGSNIVDMSSVHTSVGQTVMRSSPGPVPTMIPNPTYKLSGDGLNQDIAGVSSVHTSGDHTAMSSSCEPAPTMVPNPTYKLSSDGSNQDIVEVSMVQTSAGQTVMSSSSEPRPIMVPGPTYQSSGLGLNQDVVVFSSVDTSVGQAEMSSALPQISEDSSVDEASASMVLDATYKPNTDE